MELKEIRPRLKNELEQWFINQTRDIYKYFYLYHLPSTPEHSGDFLICSKPPANSDYELSHPERINKGFTKEQNFTILWNYIQKLPILDI
jgi:hypothetical protein